MSSIFVFIHTGWQTVFPTSFRRKPESRRFLKRFLDPGFRRGDEIKTWVKPSTGVEMSACSKNEEQAESERSLPL